MAAIRFEKAQRWYAHADRPAVAGIDLEIADGEFMVLVGPSGCGKSTSLRMLAGLEEVDAGAIHIGDRDVTTLAPRERDIAMVFQNYALYPHMTVAGNMAFCLKNAGVAKAERNKRVADAAAMLGLTDYLERKPKHLSGGQRQRVAMGRAIVRSPQVFCMDEPLSNLDAAMRVQTRGDIARLQRELGVTTVYVTHDQVEAMTMGDRVAVMKDGEIQQVGAPIELYDHPVNTFVAGFVGTPSMTMLAGHIDHGVVSIGEHRLTVRVPAEHTGAVTVGIRPESWRVVPDGQGIPVVVSVVEELGAEAYVHARAVISEDQPPVVIRSGGRAHARPGERIWVTAEADRIHVFDGQSGIRISE
ncbi:MAG: sn-glycerol-3-phosphate ABC transporter ATP-binding protein UgpC [Gordonia sp. (in: high G+C Gram-positive bacteria)]